MTTTKRPKKRFTTEKQIIDAINNCHVLSAKSLAKADAMDRDADAAFKRSNEMLYQGKRDAAEAAKDHGEFQRKLAMKARKYATNLIEKKAKKLGAKLSELRTVLMPGMPGDESVQA